MPRRSHGGASLIASVALITVLLPRQGNSAGSSSPAAEPLPAVALFNRCYSHLARQIVPRSHPLRQEIVEGRQDPIDACMSMLGAARFDGSGKLASDTPEGRRVVRTFNDFHRTWFGANIFQPDDCNSHTSQIVDAHEPALHVTRALLGQEARYADIVTGELALEAIRTNDATGGEQRFVTVSHERSAGVTKDPVNITLAAPALGELLGVRPVNANPAKVGVIMNSFEGSTDPFGHFGGGVIGTMPYVLLNLGRMTGERSNGGVLLPRRWARAVLSELLCRDIPALRLTDAALFVQDNPGVNTPPFRTSRNCMQCHATIDPLSASARNLFSMIFAGCPVKPSILAIAHAPATLPPEIGQVDLDPDFYKRPTNGIVFYRSYDGKLIRLRVGGLKDLGTALSETNDLYVCAAARYFQFFTGIRVSLQDPGDTSLEPIPEAERGYREQVIALGLQLRSDQRLDKLIEWILRSDIYKRASQRDFLAATIPK